MAGSAALAVPHIERWELLCAYAVAIHSYTGFIAASKMGEKSVIATDLIDVIGEAMQLATDEALRGLGIQSDAGEA